MSEKQVKKEQEVKTVKEQMYLISESVAQNTLNIVQLIATAPERVNLAQIQFAIKNLTNLQPILENKGKEEPAKPKVTKGNLKKVK